MKGRKKQITTKERFKLLDIFRRCERLVKEIEERRGVNRYDVQENDALHTIMDTLESFKESNSKAFKGTQKWVTNP